MKPFSAVLLLLLLRAYTASAQTKPVLPADYFDKFSYTLSDSFNLNNADATYREVGQISRLVMLYLREAEKNYTIDSSELFSFASNEVTPAIFAGDYSTGLLQIKRSRQLKPFANYRIPFGFVHEAYLAAASLQADDHSKAFASRFRQQLEQAINRLDPSFSGDIINAQKGNFTKASTDVNRKEIENIVNQSILQAGRKLNFGAATALIDYYFRYYIRQYYQSDIESLFYALYPETVKEETVMIPMRDSIHLNAFIYRNIASKDKVPAVISLSPYPSGNEATRGNVFATNGYIYVYVDNRGRRKSEGDFFPYENDARDFYDIIDWVSKQPWCNGQVATTGGSYLGFTQWQAIRKEYRHPALKAINPMVAVGFGVDFPRFANQFYSYILQWATLVSGRDLNNSVFADYEFWNRVSYQLYKNRLPFNKLDSVAGGTNAFFQKWISHPDFDSYWTSILPDKKDYSSLDMPVLTITGYYDADQVGALYYYNQHMRYASPKGKSNHYVLIGPYDHGGAQWQPGPVQSGLDIEKEAQIPIYKYVIWWYDWVLKGKQKPAFLKDQVNYFVTGTKKWETARSFDKLATDTLSLYLSSQPVKQTRRDKLLSLTQKPPASSSILYKHDIAEVLDSAFLFAMPRPFDDSLYMTSPYNMVFESQPMTKDIIVTGKMITDLYLSLNVPDADFGVTIFEITPDGRSYNLVNTALRSRYRNGGEKPQLLHPGQVAQHRFDDVFLYIKKIPKGNKLRLVFESVNSPNFEKNYGFGGVVSREATAQPRIIEATIHTGTRYPSRILIPYRNAR